MDNLERSRPASSSGADSSMAGQMALPFGEEIEGLTHKRESPGVHSERQRSFLTERDGPYHQKGWGHHKTVAEYNACFWCAPV